VPQVLPILAYDNSHVPQYTRQPAPEPTPGSIGHVGRALASETTKDPRPPSPKGELRLR
jgi:hypothetical protein